MKVTTPSDMTSVISEFEFKEAINKFEERFKDLDKDDEFYSLMIIGRYSKEICDKIAKVYTDAGWYKVSCKVWTKYVNLQLFRHDTESSQEDKTPVQKLNDKGLILGGSAMNEINKIVDKAEVQSLPVVTDEEIKDILINFFKRASSCQSIDPPCFDIDEYTEQYLERHKSLITKTK